MTIKMALVICAKISMEMVWSDIRIIVRLMQTQIKQIKTVMVRAICATILIMIASELLKITVLMHTIQIRWILTMINGEMSVIQKMIGI